MAEDDSNSNLFVRFANIAEAVEVSAKPFSSTLEDDRKEISKKRLAEWLTEVASLNRELADKLRGTLKPAYENEKAKVIELQKKAVDLEVSILDSNLKIKTMGEELKASEKKLAVSNNVIKDMKNQQSIQDSLKNQMLQDIRTDKSLLESKTKQIDSQTEKIRGFQEKLSLCAAEISERDDQIAELNKINKHYTTEISQLKNTQKEKEDNWKADIRKLETELEEKGKSFDDLNRKLDALMLEKNEVDAQLETLRAEKCTRDNLIQELETRLNELQAEHVGIIVSFDNAQEVKNDLTAKVAELEKEVDRQNEVISYRTYEKMEAIRQLSSSLEHFKSRYEELRKASVSKNKAHCFDFVGHLFFGLL